MKFTNRVAWCPAGFRLEISASAGGKLLKISDLNPEQEINLVLTRWEAFRLGIFVVWRSLFS